MVGLEKHQGARKDWIRTEYTSHQNVFIIIINLLHVEVIYLEPDNMTGWKNCFFSR